MMQHTYMALVSERCAANQAHMYSQGRPSTATCELKTTTMQASECVVSTMMWPVYLQQFSKKRHEEQSQQYMYTPKAGSAQPPGGAYISQFNRPHLSA
jgi:hypothetical protein